MDELYELGANKPQEAFYHTAQICLNGHMINDSADTSSERNKKFCDKCGENTTTLCTKCTATIRGYYDIPAVVTMNPTPVPKYCHECGEPYPWTKRMLDAAKEYTDELDKLKPKDRELLKQSIDEIVKGGPKSEVAMLRFKKLAMKAGSTALQTLTGMLGSMISDAAKKALGFS